jgi:large subunit ribosomal protein L3
MGDERITVQNLEVVQVDKERNLLLVKGSMPGIRGSLLRIKDSVKNR